ncbi:MAG: lipocalin family protein [Bacteroidales bacterium]|nr:lipocalin family protein [Bacteroidales bacterium]MDD4383886.1 lipocalin family protein [Bacteroidales bacterium]
MKKFCNLLTIIFVVLSGSAAGQKGIGMKTVQNFSIEQFMGTWYEIARFPHSFERNLVGVTATYRFKENGNVEVINQGHKNDLVGKVKRAKAFAKIPDTNEPGRLKVFFFWPFGADYLILDLDPNYQWALVGSSSPKFLWILSRTPQMVPEQYSAIVNKARGLGYNIDKLEMVPQKETL